MEQIFINFVADAAAGEPAAYAAFFCLGGIGFLLGAGIVKLSGLPKLLWKAWEKCSEDDTYPEEMEK